MEVIRDLRLSVKPTRRRARLVYFPAYVIKYAFGEHFNNAGERRPNKHLAIVGGIGEPPACLASSIATVDSRGRSVQSGGAAFCKDGVS